MFRVSAILARSAFYPFVPALARSAVRILHPALTIQNAWRLVAIQYKMQDMAIQNQGGEVQNSPPSAIARGRYRPLRLWIWLEIGLGIRISVGLGIGLGLED